MTACQVPVPFSNSDSYILSKVELGGEKIVDVVHVEVLGVPCKMDSSTLQSQERRNHSRLSDRYIGTCTKKAVWMNPKENDIPPMYLALSENGSLCTTPI